MSNGMELQVYNVNNHQAFLQKQEAKLEQWITPSLGVRAEALTRYALHEMSLDQKLLACTPTSIYLALLQCAVTGLVPGKMRGFAYLVPFNNTYGEGDNATKKLEATFMIGWKGVKHMGFRAGIDIVSAIIHTNDDFDFDKGSNAFVRYKPALKGKGSVIGTAAWCRLPRGGLEVEYLDMERLERIQKSAERMKPSPAWRGDFRDSMQRKSAIRALGRQIEMGEEFHRAEMLQNAEEAGALPSAIDALTNGEASRVLGAASTEAMAFGQAPRPAQVQVPAETGSKLDQAKAKVAERAAAKAKPIETQASERPTPAASTTSTAPAGSSSPSPSASPASTSSAASSSAAAPTPTTGSSGASPTSPTPATSTAGSASPPASAATPAASSSAASSTPSTSAASEPAPSPENSASAPSDQSFNPFDDPEDAKPAAPAMSVEAFERWLASCKTPEDITKGKGVWVVWARESFEKGSPQAISMQEAAARRWAEVGGK